jgi:hypothetical protein
MDSVDAAFARRVHERVLNPLHLLIIGQASTTLLRQALDWIEDPHDNPIPSLGASLVELIQQAVLRSGVAEVEVACPAEIPAPAVMAGATALCDAIVEALRNAQRHANATHLRVHAMWTDDEVHVLVSDDGRGFSDGEPARLGLTLGIVDAMNSVAGRAQISNDERTGTKVLLVLPHAPLVEGSQQAVGQLASEWPQVAEGTRRLLADLVSGGSAPDQPGVTERARIEDGRIRTWLDSSRVDSWLAAQVAKVVSNAADRGRRVRTTIVGQAGITSALDFDLVTWLDCADSIMLTIEPEEEELLAVIPGGTSVLLTSHPCLKVQLELGPDELRVVRMRRSAC